MNFEDYQASLAAFRDAFGLDPERPAWSEIGRLPLATVLAAIEAEKATQANVAIMDSLMAAMGLTRETKLGIAERVVLIAKAAKKKSGGRKKRTRRQQPIYRGKK